MPADLAKKLQLKPKLPVLVLNPPVGMMDALARELPENPLTTQVEAGMDAALVYLNRAAEVETLVPESMRLVKPNGVLWIAYPKVSSGVKTDINRDSLWKLIEPTGWRPVRQVALDETWSALRFRPAEMLGK